MVLVSFLSAYRLSGSAGALGALAELAAPHFRVDSLQVARDWEVELHEGFQPGDRWTDSPEHEARVDRGSKTLIISGPRNWLHVIALRYLRALDRVAAVAGGGLPLHGACIELGGVGLALVGGHRTGKTTAAISAARRLGAAVISNDDCLLLPGRHWECAGLPRSVGLRTASLGEYSPRLHRGEVRRAALLHPRKGADKIYLTQTELARFGVSWRVTPLPLRAIIQLELDDASPSGFHTVAPLSVLERWVDPVPDRHRPDFTAAIGAAEVPVVATKIARLASEVEVLRYVHARHDWVSAFLTDLEAIHSGSR